MYPPFSSQTGLVDFSLQGEVKLAQYRYSRGRGQQPTDKYFNER